MKIPDAIDPIYGFRAWDFGFPPAALKHLEFPPPREARLYSLSGRGPWELGANEARCISTHGCHEPPSETGKCGFWGFYTRRGFTEAVQAYQFEVVGIFKAWGRVVKGVSGFRSQFAEPVLLQMFSNHRFDGFGLPFLRGDFPIDVDAPLNAEWVQRFLELANEQSK